MDKLNESQLEAVNYAGDKHLMLLAGAGSGKTRTIISRVTKLLSDGVPAERIALLTFTRRAAAEIQERLSIQHYEGSRRIMMGTFHYFSLLLIRGYPQFFGNRRYSLIDADDQESLMKFARGKNENPNIKLPKAGELLKKLSYISNSFKKVDSYLEEYDYMDTDQINTVERIFLNYRKLKEEGNYLDFDDLLLMLQMTLEEDEVFRQKIKSLFDYVLIDETQDTNPLQWRIIQSLINPAKLFCVGDDAQSIYAFRGADFRNVHEFSNRIKNSEVLKLEKNYRSTQEILDLANFILDQSSLNYDKHLEAFRGQGEKPELVTFHDKGDEAEWIASDAMRVYNEQGSWKSMMVLTRTAFSARYLESIFIARDIPYKFIGGVSLLKAAHIKDVLSFLRAVNSVNDTLAWVRFCSCWPRLGEKTSVKLAAQIADCSSPSEALEKIPKLYPKHSEMFLAVSQLLAFSKRDIGTQISQAVKIMEPLLETRYSDNWEMRKKDFDVLINISIKFENIAEFIETYTLEPISNSTATQLEVDDVVSIITVHSAKGTEAPVCYIIQSQMGNFPHSRSLGNYDNEEEERRILYVAVTRAKDRLILTRSNDSANNFWGGGLNQASCRENTYFLEGVEDLVQEKNMTYDYFRDDF